MAFWNTLPRLVKADVKAVKGIMSLYSDRCAPSFTVAAEIASQQAVKLAIAQIDYIDIKHAYHQATGHSLFHKVARTAQNVGIFDPETTGVAGQVFWKVGGLVDFLTYIYWIFAEASETVIAWNSEMHRASPCLFSGTVLYASGTPTVSAIPSDGGWYAFDFAWTRSDGHEFQGPPSVTVRGNGAYSLYANITCTQFDPLINVSTSQRITRIGSNYAYKQNNAQASILGSPEYRAIWYSSRNGGGAAAEYAVQWSSNESVPHNEVFPGQGDASMYCADGVG